jgi:hypothetical protein
VLTVNFLGEQEEFGKFYIHEPPFLFGSITNDTTKQASKVASKQTAKIKKLRANYPFHEMLSLFSPAFWDHFNGFEIFRKVGKIWGDSQPSNKLPN